MQNHKMQDTSKFSIVRPVEDRGKISTEDKKVIWSRVRMLLYLMKNSRPNIANLTQELSKVIMVQIQQCSMNHYMHA